MRRGRGRSARRRVAAGAAAVVVLVACTTRAEPDAGEGVAVAEGWTVSVVRDDLRGPTQLTSSTPGTGDGPLLVAELAGGEDAGQGRVRALGPDGTGEAEPRADSLLTPTGVAVLDGRLVVQEQDALLLYPLVDGSEDDDLRRLAEGSPPNGRSQGTLTPVSTDDGPAVLATVTGRGSGPDVGDSGQLRLVRPTTDGVDVEPVAIGFKNAYAHAFGPDGELYVTEIGDGTYDGEQPRDALHVVEPAVVDRALGGGAPYDGGWPRCTSDGDPTEEFGATAQECAALSGPLATFPPRATPTSVAVTAGGRVLVALWVEGRVVEVDPGSGAVTDVLTGVDRPQHLLALPGGDVLLTVHGSGELWRLAPPRS